MKKKNCVWLLCLLFCLSSAMNGQTIRVENGISVSSLRKSAFEKKVYPYQVSVGYEYADKGWFNLSSGIGYIKKGGKDRIPLYPDFGNPIPILTKANIHYLTLNTVFNMKKSYNSGLTLFAGAGPRLDVRLKDSFTAWAEEGGPEGFSREDAGTFRNVVLGLKCVLGFYQQLGRIPVGFQFAYLPNISKMAKKDYGCHDRTFTLGLTFGFSLPFRDKNRTYTVRQRK